MEQFFDPKAGNTWELIWGTLVCVAVWEVLRPLRPLEHPLLIRWLNNFSLAAFNIGIQYGLTTLLAIDLVLIAERNGSGLLNFVELSAWIELLIGIVWLDFTSYAIHRLKHVFSILWRIHRLHHCDPDVDFSTSRRHHPFEMFVTIPILALAILISGAPPLSLLFWGACSGMLSFIQHGNVHMPAALDRGLRYCLVTPSMHRIHHSSIQMETDSNYGQVLPWWDRIFGTYCAQPKGGLKGMVLGLEYFRTREDLYLHRMLLQPFISTGTTPPDQPEAD